MPIRTSTAVIVVATTTAKDGTERTTHYGPFLPHAGGATTSFVNRLEQELEASDRFASFELEIRTLFIGEDESDCTIVPTS